MKLEPKSLKIVGSVILFLLWMGDPVQGTLIRYDPIPQTSSYPGGFAVSNRYRVLVKSIENTSSWNSTTHKTVTYKYWPAYPNNDALPGDYRNSSVHFSSLEADEPVRIRVELLDGTTIQRLNLLPSRYWLHEDGNVQRESRAVEFNISPYDGCKHIVVEVNPPTNDNKHHHGLVIHLNPIFETPSGAGVYVFEPGIIGTSHPLMNSDGILQVKSSSPYHTYVVPAQTMLRGRFDIDKDNFKLVGRGIIDGSRWPQWKQNWSRDSQGNPKSVLWPKALVDVDDGDRVTFEGVTVIHPYNFCFGGADTMRNLKAYAWRFTSDAFHHGCDALVKDCFARVNDDTVYIAKGRTERCVIWQLQNGSPFQMGWGNAAGACHGGSRITQCDVVRSEKRNDHTNNAVFSAVYSNTKNDISDVEFRDIRIDNQVPQLIKYTPSGSSRFANFRWIDIWAKHTNGTPGSSKAYPNVIDIDTDFDGILFQNVVIGGKLCRSVEDLNLQTKNVRNIRFESGGLPVGWSFTDIGIEGSPGRADYSSDLLTLTGSRTPLGTTQDACHYVYKTLSGDCSLTARLVSWNADSVLASAGLMMRQSDAPDAAHLSLSIKPSGRRGGSSHVVVVRPSDGGSANFLTLDSKTSPPLWLRLERIDETISAALSSDGKTWETVYTESLSFDATQHLGLYLTGHGQERAMTASFDNISVLEKQTTGPTGSKKAPSKLHIGSLQPGKNYLDGAIDEVKLFDMVLSAEEIAQAIAG